MRRRHVAGLMLAGLLVAPSGAAVAQYEDHPNVGTWITVPDDPAANVGGYATVHADGTVRDWNVNVTGVGAWEPTGERTFRTTIVYPLPDGEGGLLGHYTARIEGEVSEDGQSATGIFTLEFPDDPSGAFPPPGEWGPAPFRSIRVNPEPIGEPVGPWPIEPRPMED